MKRERTVAAVAALLTLGIVACGEEGQGTSREGLGTIQQPAVCTPPAAVEGEVPPLPPPPLPPQQGCDAEVLPEAIANSFDADQNGELNLDELAKLDHDTQGKVPSFAGPMPFAPPPPKEGATGPAPLGGLENAYRDHLRDVLWIYDVDDSKGLSTVERAQLRADAKSGCQKLAARVVLAFDSNGDGSLDETEKGAAEQKVKAAMDDFGAKLLATFDANSDGTLDQTEHAAMMDKAKAGAEAQRKAVEQKYDTDGSGQLDAAERAGLRAFLRQRIVEGC